MKLPIKPIILTDEEKRELEDCMTVSFVIFKEAAATLYGSGAPASIKRLRTKYLDGDSRVCGLSDVCGKMAELQNLELRIFAGFIRVVVNLVKSMYRTNNLMHPNLTPDDYLSEAMWGIWDSIYTFDGSYRFSTYLIGVVKNRLISFIGGEERTAGISRKIKALRQRVKGLIRYKGYDTEDALSYLLDRGEVNKRLIGQVRDSMVFFVHQEEETGHEENHEQTAMYEAIRFADFTPLERELMDAHLKNDRGYRARKAKTDINPNTGQLYTRQWLGQVFANACEKARMIFERGERKAA